MFTRMTEIQSLNSESFNSKFANANKLEWEVVKPKIIFGEEDIDAAKYRFNISDNELWSIWSIFGYDMVISYQSKTNCIQFKLIDPDFGSMMCIPGRTIQTHPTDTWYFKLSVSRDDDTDSLVYHVQMILEKDDGDDVDLFSKYVVLNNIE